VRVSEASDLARPLFGEGGVQELDGLHGYGDIGYFDDNQRAAHAVFFKS
jgi:hypothetical protein